MGKKPSKVLRRMVLWVGLLLLSPIVLFAILALLLYFPPVQRWAADRVTEYVSKETGMDVSVGYVRLVWPLNLGIERMLVINGTDTIANVGHLTADVRLRPLLQRRVVVSGMEVNQAQFNTDGLISDLQIKGQVDELWVASRGIDLDRKTIEVNGARLQGGRLLVALSDTAAADTTKSVVEWKIDADSISIADTDVTLSLPGDSTIFKTYFGQLVARRPRIDLAAGAYHVESLDWNNGRFAYNAVQPSIPSKGQKTDSLRLNDITLHVDSFYADTMMVAVPRLLLRTVDSDIETSATVDLNVADSVNPGRMDISLNAQIGKQDLMKVLDYGLSGNQDPPFTIHKLRLLPNHPIEIKGRVSGNMKHMEVERLNVALPTALRARTEGNIYNLDNIRQLQATAKVSMETGDLSFLSSMVPALADGSVRIPKDISMDGVLTADGQLFTADMTARQGDGTVKAKGRYDGNNGSYSANATVKRLNMKNFLPGIPLTTLTADMKVISPPPYSKKGDRDFSLDASIARLRYGELDLDSIKAQATLKKGIASVTVEGNNRLFNGMMALDGRLTDKLFDGTVNTDMAMVNLQRFGLSKKPLTIGLCGEITVKTNLSNTHEVKGLIEDIYIRDRRNTYHPERVGVLLRANNDTTLVRLQSGTLIVKADASGGYEKVIRQLTVLKDSVLAQFDQKIIDQPAIKRLLPTGRVYLSSGQGNPLADILQTKGIAYKELLFDINTSPMTGINGEAYLHKLVYDSTRIDTISLTLAQKGDRLSYSGKVTNNRNNPQYVFNVLFDGHLHQHGALMGVRYFDRDGKMGIRLGATAEMETGGIRIKLMPERPTIGYKVFNLNPDNYILLSSNRHIEADISLMADDKTGIKIYSEAPASLTEGKTAPNLDLTVSLNHFNLDDLTAVLPYMPRITGLAAGDFHIMQDEKGKFTVATDMTVSKMTYEGSTIGNLSTELTYMLLDDDSHAIDGHLMLDGSEFAELSGNMKTTNGKPDINAQLTLTRTPLNVVNGFIPDQLFGFDGYAEGTLSIQGPLDKMDIDGEVYLDSAYLVSIPYGVRLRFDNDPVRIADSHLYIENFGLYAAGKEPLVMMGDIDFTNTKRITMDMRMSAQNFQIINAKQTARSVAFGKAFVNIFARMQGSLEQLRLRGRLDVLGSTDMTYMLLDSPLSTDNRLDELVKFTDFNDTTQTVVTRPTPTGLTADLNVNVAQGARIVCNLNAEQTNYVDLNGGGDLRLSYNNASISLTGRYTLNSSEMKYSLPIIPLKVFTIKDGSYVEFTGAPTNPTLNITATERTKATVGGSDGSPARSVAFECGVVITKTLNDMGVQFIIEAPEDNIINGELMSMSAEERGKLAVTMLTTGMYLADGNTNGFSMNAALSSFLQSEINNITGSALKTLDLQVGVDNTTNASGEMHTDYSFRFAKRFMNNRLKIQLGGKVSSGANDMPGQQQSFFDNVTMEYRLNQSGQQSVKLFYYQNVYDWLEGYTGLYGGGFIWRRKTDSLRDILMFWKKEQQPQRPNNPNNPSPTPPQRRLRPDGAIIKD